MSLGDLFRRGSGDDDRRRRAERARRLAAARAQAAIVDGFINELNSPMLLEQRPEFQRGVEALDHPCFTAAELLELSPDPTQALWQMAVTAVARREQDPGLTARLLELHDEGGPWHQHFVLKALLQHMPLAQSLAGELFFRLIGMPEGQQQFQLKILESTLSQRLAAGERPSFGDLLGRLNRMKGQMLERLLKVAADSPLAEVAAALRDEFETWQGGFVDHEVLRSVGRLWDERAADQPDTIDHAALAEQVLDVLRPLRHSPRRSVLITGEQGVGKSTLARRVGRALMDEGWLVFEASPADLVAGQRYVGDFEQRIQTLLEQIGGGRKVLWYVPEFQALGWVGTHQFNRSSALDLLLPYLETGEVALMGELPVAAYERLAQEQPRLATACELCRVAPLGEAATLELAAAWARSHDPELLPAPVLREAWLLARQYLRDREPPGCLMDFLDQARRLLLAGPGDEDAPARLDREHLIATLTALTSLPRQVLDERERLDPDHLRAFFHERILGQREAVDCLVDRIALMKAGLTDPTRPQGVFLFAGPTGTGKTEIAKALARYLFGTEDRLLRLDMSEFQAPDSLERLVGDGKSLDRDSLVLRIRKQPFAVILLDEFEKANPRVWDLFLQVFDDGRLTDPAGHTADFRHAIIILTSNLGGQAAARPGLGFDQDGRGFETGLVDRAVTRAFRPEFLNRLDRVVVFRPFSREVMREILDKELREVQQRRGLRNRDWAVVWEDSALEFLLDRGFSPTLGARPLKRAVERYLLTPLAETIVRGAYPVGDQFLYIQAQDDGLKVDFIDPEAPEEPPGEAGAETGTGTGAAAPTSLAGIALGPSGSADEFAALRGHLERLRGHLASPAWQEAKTLALSMTALPDFWESPERGAVLGEVEYRERVETGLVAAGSLVERIAPAPGGGEPRYPRKLVRQAAERLYLIDRACRSLADRSPWEAFVLIESKHEPAAEVLGADALVDRLGAMYRRWGQRRKMRVQLLEDRRRGRGRSRFLMFSVTGYAALAILAPESGLHVWEEPDPRAVRPSVQHRAQVRVEAWPEEMGAEDADALPAAARAVMARPLPGAPPVVRIYRELPDPLVKDRIRGWRSGRLDRVLEGDFDLLGDGADDAVGAGRG